MPVGVSAKAPGKRRRDHHPGESFQLGAALASKLCLRNHVGATDYEQADVFGIQLRSDSLVALPAARGLGNYSDNSPLKPELGARKIFVDHHAPAKPYTRILGVSFKEIGQLHQMLVQRLPGRAFDIMSASGERQRPSRELVEHGLQQRLTRGKIREYGRE